MRELSDLELRNIEHLTASSIDVALLQPTDTALRKAIVDATAPVRSFLREKGIHDYDLQGQGAREHGVYVNAKFVTVDSIVSTKASLYRPKTKKGDPRIWFTGLPEFAQSDDILAVMEWQGCLAVVNLTRIDLAKVVEQELSGPLFELIEALSSEANAVAHELLNKLRSIARGGLVRSVMSARADTAIGRTLEHVLGIDMNSRREPDYKGIELKSYRRPSVASRENRKTLFAKVANWDLSKFKSSREILEEFGYCRGAELKLNCTVKAGFANSQGLIFEVDEKIGRLYEVSTRKGVGKFATWLLEDLRMALAKKHNETFWVGANVHVLDGHDHFEFRDVMHTRRPILSQFDVLLGQGIISMDHLIKKTSGGRVSERGPLFKIETASLGLLFPPMNFYDLA